MKHALFLPPFGELSDPTVLMQVAAAAEQNGWDGLFLWDHILRPPSEPQQIADVWIALAAIATTTRTMRIGPMVTPTIQPRPQKLAREAVTLDWLSRGRLTSGLGLGVDASGELSKFNELVDPIRRGDALDEAADLLVRLWTGETVNFQGDYYQAIACDSCPGPSRRPEYRSGWRHGARPSGRFDEPPAMTACSLSRSGSTGWSAGPLSSRPSAGIVKDST